jgi:SWI/SNF-related matrix-associated actin-dependent regulator 1 of chromatin subfamily A
MGLGKTLTAIQVARESCPQGGQRLLVLCPASLRKQWRSSMARWVGDWGAGARIISWDALHAQRLGGRTAARDFDVCIGDEAHYIKDPCSRRAKAALPVLQWVPNVILLTGTPTPNRPIELWPLLHALRPHAMLPYREFAERYCCGRDTRYGFVARGSSRRDELADWLRRGFMLRRTQAEIGLGLPPLHQHVHRVRLADAVCARLQELEEALEDAPVERKMTLISQLFVETARAKRSAAAAAMLQQRRDDAPLIVFAHHRSMIDHLRAAAEQAGLRVGVLDGRASQARKHAVATQVEAFDVDVALLSLVAASVGFNLTRANRVLFAELYWVPATLDQAQARVWRLGQTKPVHVTRLVATGTCDERVLQCLRNKRRTCVFTCERASKPQLRRPSPASPSGCST